MSINETEFGILIVDNFWHRLKQFSPIDVTEVGIISVDKLTQPSKQLLSIDETEGGIVNVVNLSFIVFISAAYCIILYPVNLTFLNSTLAFG